VKRTLHHCTNLKPHCFAEFCPFELRISKFEVDGKRSKLRCPPIKIGSETKEPKNSNCNGRKHNEEEAAEEEEILSVLG